MWEVIIPWELTNSNDGQGHHWHRTDKSRKLAQMACEGLECRTPLDQPVLVLVTRILGKRQSKWDPSSILRGNWKQLEDELTQCGWWHDDSARWISYVIGDQDDTQRGNGPATKISVYGEVDIFS